MGIFDERALFERGPVVLFCWRAVDGWPVEHVSKNVTDVLGYDGEEFVSGAVAYAALVHEEDIGRVGSEVAAGSASGAPAFEHEPYRLRHKDGRVMWIYDFTHVIRDAAGAVTHFVGYVFDITARIDGENERMRLARLVHDSRTEAFARGTPDVLLTVDEAGIVVYASPATRKVLGHAPEALVGSPLTNIVPQRLRMAHEKGFAQYLKTGKRTMEWSAIAFRALHAGGHEVDIEAALGSYEVGAKRFMTAVLRDVTERTRQTELLVRTLELKRAVMDGSPTSIVACKGSGIIALANEQASKLFEVPAKELEGKSLYTLLAAGHGAAVCSLAAEAVFTRETRSVELPFQGKNGTKLLRHVVSPLEQADFVVSSEDVTAIRTNERSLAREAARLSSLVGHLEVGVFVEDESRRFVVVNESFCRMFAADACPADLVGRQSAEFFRDLGNLVENADEVLRRSDELGRVRVAATRDVIHTLDGRVFERDYVPVRDGEVFHGHLWTFTDVTESRTTQAKILRLNEALERRATSLAAMNGELEAFSYSVSHDLRAPLRSIHGFALALSEDYAATIDGEGQEYLKRIMNGVSRMGILIDDMLELARLGRTKVVRKTIDMGELARAVADELTASAPTRVVTWRIADGLEVHADPSLLRAALGNLLGNAHKYSRKVDHAVIELFAEPSAEGLVYVVRDNGAGFEMAHASRLFSAFERLHTRAEFEGTGVGLATVKRIVAKHGGRIWAEAAVGRGATFRFTLPSFDEPRES